MDSKPIWESKVFWLNLLTGVAAVITAAVAQGDLIPVDAMRWAVFTLAVVNILLRFVTSQPVTFSRE